ncbi:MULTISPECIES: hypothetical protein [Corallococcus]|uniref:hypothetical protein n=1 Tax=Corallococcus TaxID=83461 RepID=UPI0014948C58|nr:MULTISPECIES: hypothetical protein [Corallococcus]NPC69286.1 hypothetical protein [Corallococcus exiguus]NPD22355.1 hypothetical protein [Corallococcus exiguus]
MAAPTSTYCVVECCSPSEPTVHTKFGRATELGYSHLSPCELYAPATGQWSLTSGVLTPRSNASATLLPQGKVLVVGGHGYGDQVHGEAELFMS